MCDVQELPLHELSQQEYTDLCEGARELKQARRIEELEAELEQARSLLRKYMWHVGEMEGTNFLGRCCVPRQLGLYPFPDEAYLSADDIAALHRVEAELDSGVRAE